MMLIYTDNHVIEALEYTVYFVRTTNVSCVSLV